MTMGWVDAGEKLGELTTAQAVTHEQVRMLTTSVNGLSSRVSDLERWRWQTFGVGSAVGAVVSGGAAIVARLVP